MTTSTFLDDDDLELDEESSVEGEGETIELTRQINTPLCNRRRVEDLLEQKRLERELLEFDFRDDFRAHRDWEEE